MVSLQCIGINYSLDNNVLGIKEQNLDFHSLLIRSWAELLGSYFSWSCYNLRMLSRQDITGVPSLWKLKPNRSTAFWETIARYLPSTSRCFFRRLAQVSSSAAQASPGGRGAGQKDVWIQCREWRKYIHRTLPLAAGFRNLRGGFRYLCKTSFSLLFWI